MKFKSVIQLDGKTATGIQVPEEVVDGLAGGKRPAVTVTINSHSYRSTITPMGGIYKLPISAEHRAGAGVGPGDEVTVDVALDTAPREVVLPADLAALLAAHLPAKQFFDSLSYSHKRAYVLWIETAKKPETRHVRLEKTIEMLREQKTR